MLGEADAAGKVSHTVPAVAKAVLIIRMLNKRGPEGATLPEIATELSMSRSHCHNILRTLADCGWLLYDQSTRLFRMTGLISADTAGGLVSDPYLGDLRAILDRYSRQTGLPFSATEPLPDGTYLQLIITSHSSDYVPSAPPGFRFPVGAPIYFKARWAWSDEASRAKAIGELVVRPFTPRTIIDKEELRRALDHARDVGYAHAVAEYIDGFGSLALPVFNNMGQIILIISCATTIVSLKEREADFAQALISCVHECHKAIDGRPPVEFPRPA